MQEIVYVVEEVDSVRRSLKRLLASFSMEVFTFASLSELVQAKPASAHVCLVIDESTVNSESDLKAAIDASCPSSHIIVMTTGDGDSARRLAKSIGAVICLQKPVDAQALQDSIRWGFQKSA